MTNITQDFKSLREIGYDPNLIIFSKPARRDNIKKAPQDIIYYRNELDTLNHVKNTQQRMPLRMLVSQKARRDFEPSYEDSNSSHFSSKHIDDFLSNTTAQRENLLPYSHFSKRRKFNVATSSISIWLKNPYVKKKCASSQLLHEKSVDNRKCTENNFTEKSLARIRNKDFQETNPAIFSLPGIEDTENEHQLENNISQIPENSFRDLLNTQILLPQEILLPDLNELSYTNNVDNIPQNENLSINDSVEEKTSSYSQVKYSTDSFQANAIEFDWAPVSIQSASVKPVYFSPEEINDTNLSINSESSSTFELFDLAGDKYQKSDLFEFSGFKFCKTLE